ncbi:MAG: efflux RND transporter permease subunit [Alkalispirochaeta sp.]
MLSFLFRKSTGAILLTLVLVVLGVVLVNRLPIQLYPQTQRPRVRASINHAGISAVDFSDEYGDGIEAQLLAISGVDVLESSYENDRSSFTLTFDWDTDPDEARNEVDSAMSSIAGRLPARLRNSYQVRFFSGENAGYLIVGVNSPSVSPEELFAMLDASVQSDLDQIPDVETVEIYPVEELEAAVTLQQHELLAAGLTIADVENALQSNASTRSIGTLEEGDRSYTVRFRRGSDELTQLENIEVGRLGDQRVLLQDIAAVEIAYSLPSRVFVMNGERGIQITATPTDGGNVREMGWALEAALTAARQEGRLPSDTVFETYLDPADYIDRSVRNVVQAAIIGAFLAMLVVFLGLGEWRNTVLIGISLPTTIVLTFILMYGFGVSLNLISLGGIALAVGMVIDSSIVVIENIHRLRFTRAQIGSAVELRRTIIDAVAEVRVPVIASTLTSVLVFLPLSLTAPLTSAILGDQARTVVFSLLIAMVVALTVLPILAFLMFRTHLHAGEALTGLQRISYMTMERMRRGYGYILTAMLRRRSVTVLGLLFSGALLVAMIVGVLPQIPREIVSAPSSDRIVVFFRNAAVNDRNQIIDDVIPDLQRRIRERVGPEVVDTYADVAGRFNRLFVNLRSSDAADMVLGELQDEFPSEGDWYFNVMAWDPAQLPLPRTMDLQISVIGDDPATAVGILEQLREIVTDTEQYRWSFTNPSTSYSDELELRTRTEIIDGIPEYSESQLLSLVATILGGTTAVEFASGSERIMVRAEYPEDLIDGRSQLRNMLVPYSNSAIPLKHFFDFSESTGVSGIASEDGSRIFRLYASMGPASAAADRMAGEEVIRRAVQSDLDLPPGFSVRFDNPQQEMDDAIQSLFIALAVSLVLIFLLLAFQFNSLVIPLVILVSVPFGVIGVVASLYLFNSTLSLNSMLGTILLGGIVVNNAIIMIDFYLRIRRESSDKVEAIVQAATLRFTPILMTMLTTVFGVLPIAIGLGEGSSIVQPLGIAVSGGLVVSTAFTLFLVPGLLSLITTHREDP